MHMRLVDDTGAWRCTVTTFENDISNGAAVYECELLWKGTYYRFSNFRVEKRDVKYNSLNIYDVLFFQDEKTFDLVGRAVLVHRIPTSKVEFATWIQNEGEYFEGKHAICMGDPLTYVRIDPHLDDNGTSRPEPCPNAFDTMMSNFMLLLHTWENNQRVRLVQSFAFYLHVFKKAWQHIPQNTNTSGLTDLVC